MTRSRSGTSSATRSSSSRLVGPVIEIVAAIEPSERRTGAATVFTPGMVSSNALAQPCSRHCRTDAMNSSAAGGATGSTWDGRCARMIRSTSSSGRSASSTRLGAPAHSGSAFPISKVRRSSERLSTWSMCSSSSPTRTESPTVSPVRSRSVVIGTEARARRSIRRWYAVPSTSVSGPSP